VCNFFSFCTEPDNHPSERFYFDWNLRKQPNHKNSGDSHSHICTVFHLREDLCNKYEYNPFDNKLRVDRINNEINDRVQAEEWVKGLDFKNLIPALIWKPIIDPLQITVPDEPTKETLQLLKKWEAMRCVHNQTAQRSIKYTLRTAGLEDVYNTLDLTIDDLLNRYLFKGYSLNSYPSSVDFQSAYVSSFFAVKQKYDFAPAIKLWEQGYFIRKSLRGWHLISGSNHTRKVFIIKTKDLRKI
jgi:hypothetical protein